MKFLATFLQRCSQRVARRRHRDFPPQCAGQPDRRPGSRRFSREEAQKELSAFVHARVSDKAAKKKRGARFVTRIPDRLRVNCEHHGVQTPIQGRCPKCWPAEEGEVMVFRGIPRDYVAYLLDRGID